MMMRVMLEAALRSLLMAATVWAGLRLLRISHVVVQKVAWGLVLVAALAMPFLMRWHVVESRSALVLPVYRLSQAAHASAPVAAVPPMQAPPTVSDAAAAEPTAEPSADPSADPSDPAVPSGLMIAPLRGRFVHESSWPPVRPMAAVATIYLVVAGIFLLRLLCGLTVAFGLWRGAQPASPPLGQRHAVRVSSAIDTPVTIGSCILLPECYGEWEEAKLRMVVAHERAHVRQGDFYLQLVASLYTAALWFSPLGWLLVRKLSELGEATSDHAALEEASTRTGYAELLLEFAAMPRRPYAGVALAPGVAMARSSNIQRRIDRLLNERHFRLAFMGGKRHIVFAAALVPCALLAATSLVRVQAAQALESPQVSAAQDQAPMAPAEPAKPSAIPSPVVKVAPALRATPVIKAAPVRATPAVSVTPNIAAQTSVAVTPMVPAMPALDPRPAIIVTQSVTPVVSVVAAPSWPVVAYATQTEAPNSVSSRDSYMIHTGDGDQDSYAVVSGGSSIIASGDFGADFAKAHDKVHGDFIWFKHDGKSYVIDDPALVAQAKQLLKPMEELGHQQAELGEQQARLGAEQARLGEMQAHASVPMADMAEAMAEAQVAMSKLQLSDLRDSIHVQMPDISKEMAAAQASLQDLQRSGAFNVQIPDISKDIAAAAESMKKVQLENKQFLTQDELTTIQQRVKDMQGKFSYLQSQAGEKQSAIGEQQSNLGEQQSKLGEQQSKLGKQQSKLAEENSQKMKAMFSDALHNGKAKPVD